MPIVTFIDKVATFPADAAIKPDAVKKTKLIVSQALEEEKGLMEQNFIYLFLDNEIIIDGNSTHLEVELVDNLRKGYEATLHSYVRTHPNVFVPETPLNGSGEYAAGTTTAQFRLQFRRHEFCFLGMIVAIRKPPSPDVRYLLCDPQVGNGPPGSGMFAKMF